MLDLAIQKQHQEEELGVKHLLEKALADFFPSFRERSFHGSLLSSLGRVNYVEAKTNLFVEACDSRTSRTGQINQAQSLDFFRSKKQVSFVNLSSRICTLYMDSWWDQNFCFSAAHPFKCLRSQQISTSVG